MAKYEICIDAGKPYTEEAETLDEVKAIIKRVYEQFKNDDYQADFTIYEGDRDISETQVIEELVAEVIGE